MHRSGSVAFSMFSIGVYELLGFSYAPMRWPRSVHMISLCFSYAPIVWLDFCFLDFCVRAWLDELGWARAASRPEWTGPGGQPADGWGPGGAAPRWLGSRDGPGVAGVQGGAQPAGSLGSGGGRSPRMDGVHAGAQSAEGRTWGSRSWVAGVREGVAPEWPESGGAAPGGSGGAACGREGSPQIAWVRGRSPRMAGVRWAQPLDGQGPGAQPSDGRGLGAQPLH